MEKYGVDLKKIPKNKEAEDKTKNNCPVCDKELDKNCNAKHCGEHGTEPFEEEEEDVKV